MGKVNGVLTPLKAMGVNSKIRSGAAPNSGAAVAYVLPDGTLAPGNVINVVETSYDNATSKHHFVCMIINSTANTAQGPGDCGTPLIDLKTSSIVGFHLLGGTLTMPQNGALCLAAYAPVFRQGTAPLNGQTLPSKH
jgi:hypothetical protein